MTAVHEVRKG